MTAGLGREGFPEEVSLSTEKHRGAWPLPVCLLRAGQGWALQTLLQLWEDSGVGGAAGWGVWPGGGRGRVGGMLGGPRVGCGRAHWVTGTGWGRTACCSGCGTCPRTPHTPPNSYPVTSTVSLSERQNLLFPTRGQRGVLDPTPLRSAFSF